MRVLSHLLGSAIKDLFSAVGMALMFAVIGGGATLLVSYAIFKQWAPTILTDVTAGIIAVLAGYAGATTIILRSISRAVVGATNVVATEAKKAA